MRSTRRRSAAELGRLLPWVVIPVIIVALPFWVPAYRVDFVSDSLALALLAVSVSVLWGRCRLLSFGQSVFFGIGALCVGVVGTRTDHVGWLALLLAIALPGAIALAMGYFLLYGGVRRALFGVLTLALTVVATSVAFSWSDLTGGEAGLYTYPSAELSFGVVTVSFDTPATRYYLAAAVFGLGTLLMYSLLRSSWGRTLDAVSENEDRALALGYRAPAYLTFAFAGCGALAGLGGGVYALTTRVASGELLGLQLATEAILWAAIGGLGNVYRVAWAVLAVRLFQELIIDAVPEAWPILLGSVFIAVVFVTPHLRPLSKEARRWARRPVRTGRAAAEEAHP